MGYTEKKIIEMCSEKMQDPKTFYQAPVVNYLGRTTDTYRLYNEVVAEYVYEHRCEFIDGIPTITREETYKTASHIGGINPNSNRDEERIAIEMFNQKKFDLIGEILDYQTPLKKTSEDTAGKIDLLSYDGKVLYILELKRPDSAETMLRCVLEGYTYMKTADTEKLFKDFGLPEDTKVVSCPLVFLDGEQHKEMSEDRPQLKLVMKELGIEAYYLIKENDKYRVVKFRKFNGNGRVNKIKPDLDKLLDYAIMRDETAKNPAIKAGYKVIGNPAPYGNYLDNECWKRFVDDMKANHKDAYTRYGAGAGKELDERKNGEFTYPPKMASFGSSSRMIYDLMKSDGSFFFEEKLSTVVGRKANLDGFKETDEKYVFVEAKCREPYSHKTDIVSDKYKDLYNEISKSAVTGVVCRLGKIKDKKMKVTFLSGDRKICHFDLKQMICHLLGVANKLLGSDKDIKKIEFIYLLFNPNLIKLGEGEEKILKIYNETCNECNSIDFKALFEVIVDYLQNKKNIGKDKNKADIVNAFTFKLCDQSNMSV